MGRSLSFDQWVLARLAFLTSLADQLRKVGETNVALQPWSKFFEDDWSRAGRIVIMMSFDKVAERVACACKLVTRLVWVMSRLVVVG